MCRELLDGRELLNLPTLLEKELFTTGLGLVCKLLLLELEILLGLIVLLLKLLMLLGLKWLLLSVLLLCVLLFSVLLLSVLLLMELLLSGLLMLLLTLLFLNELFRTDSCPPIWLLACIGLLKLVELEAKLAAGLGTDTDN